MLERMEGYKRGSPPAIQYSCELVVDFRYCSPLRRRALGRPAIRRFKRPRHWRGKVFGPDKHLPKKEK